MKSLLPKNWLFKWEFSVDFFGGVIGGLFSDDQPIIYEAIVKDTKVQASMNFTVNYKVQVLDLIKVDFEFEFVPALITFGVKHYSTSYLGDNCIWAYTNHHTLMYQTRVTKNIARCGMNARDKIAEADSWDDLQRMMKYDAFNFWLSGQKCYFEDELNSNV